MTDQTPAVVLGIDNLVGLQTTRILTARGIPVIGVTASRKAPLSRTRLCDRIEVGSSDDGSLVDTLIKIGNTLPQKAALFPSADTEVRDIVNERSALEEFYEVRLPDKETIDTLSNKDTFAAYAEQHGLPIPASHPVSNETDLHDAIEGLRFPAVLKPDFRDARWVAHTKEKAFKVENSRELLDLYQEVASWSDRFVVQDWIVGDETNLVACNAYFDRDSQPLAAFVSRKIRQWPPRTGRGAFAEAWNQPDVRDTTIALFQNAGFVGLAYLEMKRDDRDGQFYIIEPNLGRPTGHSGMAEASGVELTMTAYCDAVGLDLPSQRTQDDGSSKWIYIRWDLQSALTQMSSGELGVVTWLKSLRGIDSYAVFSTRDPLPFVLDLLETALDALKGAWLRIFRKGRSRAT